MANSAIWRFGVVAFSLAIVVLPADGQTEDCTLAVQERDSAEGAALLQTKGSSEKEVAHVEATNVKVAGKKAGVVQHAERSISEKHTAARKVEANLTSGAKDAQQSGVGQLMLVARKIAESKVNKVKQLVGDAVAAKITPPPESCEKKCNGITDAMAVFGDAASPADFEKQLHKLCSHTGSLSCAAKQSRDCQMASSHAASIVKLTGCFCSACPGLPKAYQVFAENEDKCSSEVHKAHNENAIESDCRSCAPVMCPYHNDWKCEAEAAECDVEGDVTFRKTAIELHQQCTQCEEKGLYGGRSSVDHSQSVYSGGYSKSKAVGQRGYSFLTFSSVSLFTFVMGWHAC